MRRQRLWWLNLVRGIIALMVGLLILGWPDVGGHLFVNFIAMFWLLSGIMSLQWGLTTHQKRGLWLLAGVGGTVVGSALLLRFSYQSSIDPAAAVRILGALAVCIGLMNLLGGFRIATMTQEESLGRFLQGLFEVGLGCFLIIQQALGPLSKFFAGGWAFIGGAILILQAIQMRRAMKQNLQVDHRLYLRKKR